jgi:hypothetical protein
VNIKVFDAVSGSSSNPFTACSAAASTLKVFTATSCCSCLWSMVSGLKGSLTVRDVAGVANVRKIGR